MSHALSDLVAQAPANTARVELRHVRRRTFRWLFLPELALALVVVCLAIPLLIVLAVLGESVPVIGFDDLAGRMWNTWHDVVLRLRDGGGEKLTEQRHTPEDRAAGDALVGGVLAAAQDQGLVVAEALDLGGSEVTGAWVGGSPLMASKLQPPDRVARVLEGAGLQVETGTAHRVRWHEAGIGRIGALALLLVTWPIALPFAAGRQRLRELAGQLMGGSPAHWELVVDAGAVRLERSWGGSVTVSEALAGSTVLGVAFGPELTWDTVARTPPRLRVVGSGATLRADVPAHAGPALADWAVHACLAHGLGWPAATRGTRCPFCQTAYSLAEAERCPSCGAPPDDLTALAR